MAPLSVAGGHMTESSTWSHGRAAICPLDFSGVTPGRKHQHPHTLPAGDL